MSHIVTIKTEIRDAAAVQAACQRLGLAAAVQQTVQLYSGQATGLSLKLPGWEYPIVCDTATGQVNYDNFGGLWGQQRELDRFLQAYAVEKAKIEARRKGYNVTEAQRADGNVVVTIGVPDSQPSAQPSLWGRFRSMFSRTP